LALKPVLIIHLCVAGSSMRVRLS